MTEVGQDLRDGLNIQAICREPDSECRLCDYVGECILCIVYYHDERWNEDSFVGNLCQTCQAKILTKEML